MKTAVKIVAGVVGTLVVLPLGVNVALAKSTKFRTWYIKMQHDIIRNYSR